MSIHAHRQLRYNVQYRPHSPVASVWRASLLKVFICLGLLAIFGCTKEVKKGIIVGPPIPGANVSGGYDCLQFGFMKLRQTGISVKGSYEGMRGNGDQGTIQGKIEGDVLWVEWQQPGNMEAAVLPKRGKGWLRISNKGSVLKGRWGYDDSKEDGGQWEATRSEFY
jgi:hypothetical protein